MSIEHTFESRKGNPLFNTSYPISPDDWIKYRTSSPLSFQGEVEVSFYVHMPFCKKICSFCEYTKMICPNDEVQRMYVQTIDNDISLFVREYGDSIKLRGFDVGGGTPTALTDNNFSLLLQIFKKTVDGMKTTDDFEPSIEGTFETITDKKTEMIVDAGIERVSLGVQSSNGSVLSKNHRDCVGLPAMKTIMALLRDNGIKKINLDLMYGLKGQTNSDIIKDIQLIEALSPEQVTLYELRTNMISESTHKTADELYDAYSRLYKGLRGLGYCGRFGQNTFSINRDDMGVSSYLRSRMLDGTAYKGFGISAQSMCKEGVAYNVGKSSGSIRELLGVKTFNEEFTYKLPASELASKYIAIGAYCGSFSLDRLSEILGCDSREYYSKQLSYCLSEKLISIHNNRVHITPKGFVNYGAVFSLFYLNDYED